MMTSIPESELQKKFKKTTSQNASETWQNKYKKPAWQQDTRTWSEKFNHSTKYVYKPISESYYIKQLAGMFVDGVNLLGAHYFFKGAIVLKEDGSLFVSAMGTTPASAYETTTIWDMTAEINVNEKVILKESFQDLNKPSLWPKDSFTIIGEVNLKLPSPKIYNKVKLILRGGYALIIPEMGNANVTPQPP